MAELQDVKSTRWKIQFRRDYYHYFILFIMNVTCIAALYNSQKLRINRYNHKDMPSFFCGNHVEFLYHDNPRKEVHLNKISRM